MTKTGDIQNAAYSALEGALTTERISAFGLLRRLRRWLKLEQSLTGSFQKSHLETVKMHGTQTAFWKVGKFMRKSSHTIAPKVHQFFKVVLLHHVS